MSYYYCNIKRTIVDYLKCRNNSICCVYIFVLIFSYIVEKIMKKGTYIKNKSMPTTDFLTCPWCVYIVFN